MTAPKQRERTSSSDRFYVEALGHLRRYEIVQERITNIERSAAEKYPDGVWQYKLKTAEEYWLYRDLCEERDREMKIAQLYATMATALPR